MRLMGCPRRTSPLASYTTSPDRLHDRVKGVRLTIPYHGIPRRSSGPQSLRATNPWILSLAGAARALSSCPIPEFPSPPNYPYPRMPPEMVMRILPAGTHPDVSGS